MNRKKLILNLFKKAYLIRASDELIAKHYDENDMKTPMHMSIGEEGISAGVCSALGKKSQTFGTYRSHGLYLALTEETDKYFAELFGKVTGLLKGKGGSMHLSSPNVGLMGVSAIVGSTLPLAIGSSFANVYLKKNSITAIFFGDGAVDEGSFWESLNIACLMKLPVLFVCEDNGYAVHSPPSDRRGFKSLVNIIKQYDCSVFETDSTDAEEIHNLALKAIDSIESNHQPSFIHLTYYRYLEHVGVHEDYDAGYRSKKDLVEWQKKDPIMLLRNKLKSLKVTEENIKKLEDQIINQVNNSFQKAKKSPFPNASELLKNTFF